MTDPIDGAKSPRFAQVATWGRLPHRRDFGSSKAIFLGIPWDDATSFRSGAREGPSAIRNQSRLVRPYNMFTQVYQFRVLDVVDWGDVDTVPGFIDDTFSRIETALTPVFEAGVVPFIAGGDHSISLPVLRARRHASNEPVNLLHFDAHFDTWDTYWQDKRFTHGTWVRRASEEGLLSPGHVVQVGIRSSLYAAEDVGNNARYVHTTYTTSDVEARGLAHILDAVRHDLGDGPTYVSLDIDVLDPAFAPGTGTPEPGGLSTRELTYLLRGLARVNVVGFDLVEVAPQYDHGGQVTALAASHLIYEGMCALASRLSGRPS